MKLNFYLLLTILSCNSIYSQDDLEIYSQSPYTFLGFVRNGIQGVRENTQLENSPVFFSDFTTLRLGGTFENDLIKSEISADTDLFFTNRDKQTTALTWGGSLRNRFLPLEDRTLSNDYAAKLGIHRAFIAYNPGEIHISMGREAISWGQGRLINPMDLITPIDPLILDIESVPGADVVNLTWFWNDTDSIEIVAAPYRRSDSLNYKQIQIKDVNALARVKYTAGQTDIAAVGGRQFHANLAGVESATDISGLSLRFAWLYRLEPAVNAVISQTIVQVPTTSIHQGVAGASYAFSEKWALNSELLYNGFADSNATERRQLAYYESRVASGESTPLNDDVSFFATSGRFLSRNPLFFQFSLTHEINISWKLNVYYIHDIKGNSGLILPQLEFSPNDYMVCVFALRAAAWQNDKSEFWGQQPTTYGFLRYYF